MAGCWKISGCAVGVILTTHVLSAGTAQGFPPYRSTDADTADPDTLEARVGIDVTDRSGNSEIRFPRIRMNLGLPNKIELVSEFDYVPEAGKADDAAVGVKWIPYMTPRLNIGLEALALLPVRPGDDGTGTETQIVATWKSDAALFHLNAGGIYDARGLRNETGWRTSALTEFQRENYRFGLEIFAKDTNRQTTDLRVGAGSIINVGTFQVRLGIHAGLTREAPDFIGSLWFSRTSPLL